MESETKKAVRIMAYQNMASYRCAVQLGHKGKLSAAAVFQCHWYGTCCVRISELCADAGQRSRQMQKSCI